MKTKNDLKPGDKVIWRAGGMIATIRKVHEFSPGRYSYYLNGHHRPVSRIELEKI